MTSKLIDLSEAVAEAVASLRASDERPSHPRFSAVQVLAELGVSEAPSLLEPEGSSPPSSVTPLGRFTLGKELGRGGMGRVVEAHDPVLRRTVAIKLLVDPRRVSRAQLARFVAEAQITGQLEHPSIVPVHETGWTEDGNLFFVMKRVEGRTLQSVLSALGTGDAESVAQWSRHRLLVAFQQVCNAVAYAHGRGVVHRDLKPENIMLGAHGEVQVMDWGVARILDAPTEHVETEEAPRGGFVMKTLDGAIIGTPGYMSPEQAMGERHRVGAR